MAAATATTLASSAARQFSRSASTIFTREVSGSHKLTIDGYSASRKIPKAWWQTSQTFEAAGYSWRIWYFPNGGCKEEGGDDDDCISLYLEHVHGGGQHHLSTDPVQFEFSLLDQAGNSVPGYSRRSKELFAFSPSGSIGGSSPAASTTTPMGFDDFAKWKDLHESGALKDDRFTIRCDITAIRDWPEPDSRSDGGGGGGAPVVVPPSDSDLHQNLSDLLWKDKHGTDMAIDVAGETFDVHGWLLAARSPVLAAKLQAMTSGVMKIKGIEPKVFRTMLHFMYTDALPAQQDDDDGVEMARGLLAAAHRYKLEKLKLMCVETLCRRIDVDTVAAILVTAEEHQCQALKAACLEFMARPGCIKAVMETRGFEEMKSTCLPLLVDLLVKQLT